MPTYGYRCTVCGKEFERFQKMTDPPVRECEFCGSPVKKMLYPVAISFKGSGFYVNDSAKPGASGKADSDTSEPKPEAKSETTVEAKTESGAKTESKAETAPATPEKKADKPKVE